MKTCDRCDLSATHVMVMQPTADHDSYFCDEHTEELKRLVAISSFPVLVKRLRKLPEVV